MEVYLVFRFDGTDMKKSGLVHANSAEQAIEVAKRMGILAPIVQLKKDYESCSTAFSDPRPSFNDYESNSTKRTSKGLALSGIKNIGLL